MQGKIKCSLMMTINLEKNKYASLKNFDLLLSAYSVD